MIRTKYAAHGIHFSNNDVHDTNVHPFIPYVREPGSALTHFIAFAAAVIMTPFILSHAKSLGADRLHVYGLLIFMGSMIVLYAASTIYHTFDISENINLILKKIDHMSICILIAGSYTPVCLTVLRDTVGLHLLTIVWILAAAGMIFKLFWVTCPKWVSSIIYISMGWVCVIAMPELIRSLLTSQFMWLLAGGLIYTAGGVIYALKFPVFHDRFKYFGCHELFHVFVMAGSLCHFIAIYTL